MRRNEQLIKICVFVAVLVTPAFGQTASTNDPIKLLVDRLDLEKLGRTAGDAARDEVLILIRNSVNSEAVPLSFAERERLSREILDEIFGLGPLEPLLKDNTISDILVNRFDRVYVERAGKLELTSFSFSAFATASVCEWT